MGPHPLLEAARSLAPELDQRALEGERLGTMPLDLVEKIRDAGLFHIDMPAELGGAEADMPVALSIIEELSRADGSAGWTVMINNSSAFLAWLEPEVAKELVSEHPRLIAASMFGPTATARQDGDEFVIDGRWPFNSGCQHSDFLINGVMVMDGEKPRQRPDGQPDWRFAFIPRSEAEILDTWHVSGLRATGSNDTQVNGVRVPVERTMAPLLEDSKFGGPVFRLPFPTLLCGLMSGFPLGVARRALDELVALAQSKGRIASHTMADDDLVQAEVAKSTAELGAARALVLEAVQRAIEAAAENGGVDYRLRAEATMAALHVGATARRVVDTVCSLAGGTAIYETSPVQRCARDIAAGTAHIFFSYPRWREAGRILMGKEPTTSFI